jgi:hypothetical protein
MGLVGQASRMIVGLSTLAIYKVIAPPTNQDLFNLARLLFSLIVGFVAGFLAGLVQWQAGGIDSILVDNFSAMLKFAIAGYIGTDVIEAFTTQFFEPALKSETSSSDPATTITTTAVTASGSVTAAYLTGADRALVPADDIIATMKDVALLKQAAGAVSAATSTAGVTPLIYGFDTDHYPGDASLGWLRIQAQLRVSVCYLAHQPGSSDPTWISKVAYLKANGWGLLPTYAGLQILSAGLSAASGARHAAEAVQLMSNAGFAPSSIVYLDLEDGTPPAGDYLDYIKAWISTVTAKGFTPALYCSHRIVDDVRPLTPIVWSFHIPNGTEGLTYDPTALPTGSVDPNCIATQYRQKVYLRGLAIPASVDSEGLDLNVCLVADPSNYASVSHALQI